MEGKFLADKHMVNLIMPQYKSNLLNIKYPVIKEKNSLEEIISSICNGIQCLHENGCIHGNLKPSNVYFQNDEMNKCCLSDYMKNEITPKDSIPITSYYYMSPEMIKEEEIDISTDIWSFGCLLYYIFSGGIVPFHSNNAKDLLEKIHIGKYNKIRHSSINNLLSKLLRKTPKSRLLANELLIELKCIY